MVGTGVVLLHLGGGGDPGLAGVAGVEADHGPLQLLDGDADGADLEAGEPLQLVHSDQVLGASHRHGEGAVLTVDGHDFVQFGHPAGNEGEQLGCHVQLRQVQPGRGGSAVHRRDSGGGSRHRFSSLAAYINQGGIALWRRSLVPRATTHDRLRYLDSAPLPFRRISRSSFLRFLSGQASEGAALAPDGAAGQRRSLTPGYLP